MSQRATRIKAVNHASFHWVNQFGMKLAAKPRTATVHAQPVGRFSVETQERIKAQRLEDRWTPVVRLYLSMARVIRYDGERAQTIWREYCAGIYGKKGKA